DCERGRFFLFGSNFERPDYIDTPAGPQDKFCGTYYLNAKGRRKRAFAGASVPTIPRIIARAPKQRLRNMIRSGETSMIQAYPDRPGLRAGEKLRLHVSTDNPHRRFRVDFYRQGERLFEMGSLDAQTG